MRALYEVTGRTPRARTFALVRDRLLKLDYPQFICHLIDQLEIERVISADQRRAVKKVIDERLEGYETFVEWFKARHPDNVHGLDYVAYAGRLQWLTELEKEFT